MLTAVISRGFALLFLGLTLTLSAARFATAADPPAKKPATKGTAQLPGSAGKVGVTYTVQSGDNAFNLTVKRLYFVGSHMPFKGGMIAPDPGQKFLVLEYTVQNPNSNTELQVGPQTFRMTAVDANNQNYELFDEAENTGTHDNLDVSLKPGQRVEAKEYFVIPIGLLVPKIILAYSADKVMRFDLHGLVGKVEPYLADPADPTGTIVRATIPDAKFGAVYPVLLFDVAITGVSFADGPFGSASPDEGKRFLVVSVKAKNLSTKEALDFNFGNVLIISALDVDGDKSDFTRDYFKASSTEPADSVIAPGVEKTFRVLIPISKTTRQKTLTLAGSDDDIKFVYDLSAVK